MNLTEQKLLRRKIRHLIEAELGSLEGKSENKIIEFFKDNVTNAYYEYLFSEYGKSFDLTKGHKEPINFLEKMFKDNGFISIDNDWDEDDSKGTLKNKFDFEFTKKYQEINSGNTYNGSWLFPTDINWRYYELKEGLLLECRIHLGIDIRRNYSGGYYKKVNSEDFIHELLQGSTILGIEFKDNSSIVFDGNEWDVNNFTISTYTKAKTYEHMKQIELFGKKFPPVEGGLAPMLNAYISKNFKGSGFHSGLDEFLFEIADEKLKL